MIIKLNRRHIDELADIDYESEHQNDVEQGITRQEMRKELVKRFDTEQFYGYKDGELKGYVTLKPFSGYKHCEIYWLAVRKQYQGQGIGTKLLKFVEGKAKQLGYRKVFVYTGKNMVRTRHFYEKNGYEYVNEFPEYYGYSTGEKTAVLYGKKL